MDTSIIGQVKNMIDKKMPDVIKWRRRLHEIPELSFHEYETTNFIREILESNGYVTQFGVENTGVVTTLETGRTGKTIGLRADIDALSIEECTNLAYKSQNPGKMHACGHDGHVATLLMTACILREFKDKMRGSIKFIFQPAEERGNGALAMIKNGVLDNPSVDAIFGYHGWPGLPIGKIGIKSGTILAGFSRVIINVYGKIGHVAFPEDSVNLVNLGCFMVSHLNTMCSETVSATECALINITNFQSNKIRGFSDNITIGGYLYAELPSTINKMKEAMIKRINSIADMYGQMVTINFEDMYNPTINSLEETKQIINIAQNILGEENIVKLETPKMMSEDFSEYLRRVPGCIFLLGLGENSSKLHTNTFDFPDASLANAIQLMSSIPLTYLAI